MLKINKSFPKRNIKGLTKMYLISTRFYSNTIGWIRPWNQSKNNHFNSTKAHKNPCPETRPSNTDSVAPSLIHPECTESSLGSRGYEASSRVCSAIPASASRTSVQFGRVTSALRHNEQRKENQLGVLNSFHRHQVWLFEYRVRSDEQC